MNRPEILHFPKLSDSRGCLVFMEGENHIPFLTEKIVIIESLTYDKFGIEQQNIGVKEVLICLNGFVEIFLQDNNGNITKFDLNSRNCGLYVPAMCSWSLENNGSDFSILVISDEKSKKSIY